MQYEYGLFTLVDISSPGNLRQAFPFVCNTGDLIDGEYSLNIARNQQANFNTVVQCAQLRANIRWEHDPEYKLLNLNHNNSFGRQYQGEHKVWYFRWLVETVDVYIQRSDPVGGLTDDFHQVPINSFCKETATFPLNVFDTQHPEYKNTHFINLGRLDK